MKVYRLILQAIMLASLASQAVASNSTQANAADGYRGLQSAAGMPGFLIAPVPTWVIPATVPTGAEPPHAPMYYRLIDDQSRVGKDGVTRFTHVERVVTESSGLAVASQIEIQFDPSYQDLVLHKLAILREGHRIDKLDRKNVRLLQRETKLEEGIYDGSTTASIVLHDVRVGDRIEYAYSIRGMNPVFGGKFVATEMSASVIGPTMLYQFRLLHPEQRSIAYRAGPNVKVSTQTRDGVREVLFRRTAADQIRFDQNAPESAYVADFIQLSEFKDWAEVAKWGTQLFDVEANRSAAVQRRAEQIKSATASPVERLRLALDFVQREIRYFGVEIGANTHRPVTPGMSIEQRSGDCKDKVMLLIALLKEMNIEAAPVLVSTHYLHEVDSLEPSPLAFNHVIARVTLDGTVYWLDGTRSYQTGPVARRQSVGLGKGLVLQPAVAGLTELPGTESEVRIVVHELIRFEKMSESPMLESRTTYYGDMAEGVRDAVAKLPFAQIEGELALEYGRFYPGIQRVGHVRIEEAPDENAINVVQQFTIPEFFSFSEQRLLVQKVTFWNPVRALRHPSDLSRKMPFRLQAPGIYRHHIEISFPEDVLRTGNSAHFGDSHPAFQYSVEYKASPRRFEFDSELDLLKSEVAPEDWPSYTDKLVKLDPRFAGYLNIPAIALPQAEKLNAELREVSTSRSNAVTTVQRDARIRRIVLTAQLDSGRLSPLLRADTLRERGEQMDNMGKPEEATRDFEEAIQLAPNASKVFVSAATNAFARGRDERAAELAKNALALAPFDSSPHQILAFVEYYRGNYSEATGHLMAFGKNNRDETMKLYAALWLYLSAGHSGQDGIAAAKEQMPAGPSSRWPNPILQLLMGAGTLEQALKAAKDGTNDPSKLCELYFYLGEKSLFDGDKSRARKYFQQSIDTGVVEFNEYLFARRSLARLNE